MLFPRTKRLRAQSRSAFSVTYIGLPGGHKDGEVREVVTGAGGGVATDVEGPAASSGPAALQSLRLVLPKGTFDGVAFDVYRLWRRRRRGMHIKALTEKISG